MNLFAVRLRQCLIERKLSQSAFARILGISQDSINSYCTGRREPDFDILISIAKTLNVTTDYLLGLSD